MRTARRLADQLRQRREALGLTLQEVSRRSAEMEEPVPISTLSRIERGVLDPGVRRLHVLLRIYRIDPVIAADLAELESLADDPPDGDIGVLSEDAQRFWREGNVPQTLSRILAILSATESLPEHKTERQKALLFSAVVARSLGRIPLARRIIDELLCQPLEGPLLVDVLVIAAALWRASGSLEVALALAARASLVVDRSDTRRLAFVLHQQAKLESERGVPERAEELLHEAFEGYRASGDVLNEARARVLRIGVLEKLGRLEDAIDWARLTVSFTEEKDVGFVKISAYLELGRLLIAAGRAAEAVEELRRALASAVLLGATDNEGDAHRLLADAFEALGETTRARAERARAVALERVRTGDEPGDVEMHPAM